MFLQKKNIYIFICIHCTAVTNNLIFCCNHPQFSHNSVPSSIIHVQVFVVARNKASIFTCKLTFSFIFGISLLFEIAMTSFSYLFTLIYIYIYIRSEYCCFYFSSAFLLLCSHRTKSICFSRLILYRYEYKTNCLNG